MRSGFQSLHPYVAFYYYLCVGLVAMFFNHPLFLALAIVTLIGVNVMHDGGRTLKKWLPMLVGMGLLFTFLNPILNSRGTHIFFYFRGKQVTLEALVYGGVTAMSLILILLLFMSFNFVLNGTKFLYIFSRFFPRTAFLTMLAIRFVPLLKRRLDEIKDVQRVKGITVASGTVSQRAKSGMVLIQILLTWSLEEAVETADSMKARGYGLGKRSSYIPYRMEKEDWGSLAILVGLSAICSVGGSLGYGKIVIYPALGTLHFFPLDWMVLVGMLLLLAFPLLLEGREQLRWRYTN